MCILYTAVYTCTHSKDIELFSCGPNSSRLYHSIQIQKQPAPYKCRSCRSSTIAFWRSSQPPSSPNATPKKSNRPPGVIDTEGIKKRELLEGELLDTLFGPKDRNSWGSGSRGRKSLRGHSRRGAVSKFDTTDASVTALREEFKIPSIGKIGTNSGHYSTLASALPSSSSSGSQTEDETRGRARSSSTSRIWKRFIQLDPSSSQSPKYTSDTDLSTRRPLPTPGFDTEQTPEPQVINTRQIRLNIRSSSVSDIERERKHQSKVARSFAWEDDNRVRGTGRKLKDLSDIIFGDELDVVPGREKGKSASSSGFESGLKFVLGKGGMKLLGMEDVKGKGTQSMKGTISESSEDRRPSILDVDWNIPSSGTEDGNITIGLEVESQKTPHLILDEWLRPVKKLSVPVPVSGFDGEWKWEGEENFEPLRLRLQRATSEDLDGPKTPTKSSWSLKTGPDKRRVPIPTEEGMWEVKGNNESVAGLGLGVDGEDEEVVKTPTLGSFAKALDTPDEEISSTLADDGKSEVKEKDESAIGLGLGFEYSQSEDHSGERAAPTLTSTEEGRLSPSGKRSPMLNENGKWVVKEKDEPIVGLGLESVLSGRTTPDLSYRGSSEDIPIRTHSPTLSTDEKWEVKEKDEPIIGLGLSLQNLLNGKTTPDLSFRGSSSDSVKRVQSPLPDQDGKWEVKEKDGSIVGLGLENVLDGRTTPNLSLRESRSKIRSPILNQDGKWEVQERDEPVMAIGLGLGLEFEGFEGL